jgi:hypothetical protein
MRFILSFLFLLPLKVERYSPLDGKDLKRWMRRLTVKYILELLTVALVLNSSSNIKEQNEFSIGELTKTSVTKKVFYSKFIKLKN